MAIGSELATSEELERQSSAKEGRIAKYQVEVQQSRAYVSQRTRLSRLTSDLAYGAELATIVFSRYPHAHGWMLSRLTTEVQESSMAVYSLAANGIFNSGRRELRYMMESAVKYVFVDQRLPGDAAIVERERYLHACVPRSSIGVIDETSIRMLRPDEFRQAVKSVFGGLSAYVHPSEAQLRERRLKLEKGEDPGYESAETLSEFVDVLTHVYDVVMALILEGIGPTFTGDAFVQALDDHENWKFHRTKFCKIIARHFDYKLERQN